MATAPYLSARLAPVVRDGSSDVKIDMSRVSFCDSTGLRALLIAHRQLKALGRDLAVVDPSVQVARLLDLTGLNELIRARERNAAS